MLIALTQLDPHPHNANVMPEALLAKLAAHIRDTGRYPPLIVHPQPHLDYRHTPIESGPTVTAASVTAAGARRYQILDGHHRAQALRRLGHAHAQCEVWDHVDDQHAAILLLTLNRLRGEDDPFKRGDLLARLTQAMPTKDLARLLPDELERIERLMALVRPPAAGPATPLGNEVGAQAPRAITFFLDASAHEQVLQRLREIDRDRTQALFKALAITPAIR